ncbi:uncharacterized protein [Taeniopygia guttata]|uniref:uncharacterized protein isoform X2 n=1 Tax=Taeniopygia guttata TaxID=59729 RepID=UPI003BB91F8B
MMKRALDHRYPSPSDLFGPGFGSYRSPPGCSSQRGPSSCIPDLKPQPNSLQGILPAWAGVCGTAGGSAAWIPRSVPIPSPLTASVGITATQGVGHDGAGHTPGFPLLHEVAWGLPGCQSQSGTDPSLWSAPAEQEERWGGSRFLWDHWDLAQPCVAVPAQLQRGCICRDLTSGITWLRNQHWGLPAPHPALPSIQ